MTTPLQRFALRFVDLHDRRTLAENGKCANKIYLYNEIELGDI